MTVLLQIRDVDPDVRDELKARASKVGMSLNAYLKDVLTQAASAPTRESVISRIEARTERSAVSATGLIRAERDARSSHE